MNECKPFAHLDLDVIEYSYCVSCVQVPPFKQTLMDALPYVDYLFGNENEAATFAESEKWETRDIAEIAVKVRRLHLTNSQSLRYVWYIVAAVSIQKPLSHGWLICVSVKFSDSQPRAAVTYVFLCYARLCVFCDCIFHLFPTK